MSKESLLQTMLDHDVFAQEDQMVSGIVSRAVANGYDTLTDKQKRVLEPFMSHPCDGVEDPGGYHNECRNVLTGDQLETAYENQNYYDAMLCTDCVNDYEGYQREWERIRDE